MRKKKHLGPEIVERDIKKMVRIKRRELYSRWGCGWWKNYLTFVQLPIWLAFMETIRGMCGMGKGLFGLIMGGRVEGGNLVEGVTSVDSPSAVLAGTAESSSGLISASGLTDEAGLGGTLIPAPIIPLEPGFTTEGILWLTDLTAPDPTLLLPFMLSGAMLLNLMPSRRVAQSTGTRRLTNALRVIALAVGPLTLQMPSAMLLYWCSSSMFAFGQGILMDKLMPLRRPVPPCNSKK
jgi:inner membrane protein COX18